MNSIYNFWPREGESIAQAWRRLKLLMLKCPSYKFPRETIIMNFYARLPHHDKELLDASSKGSFMNQKIDDKWNLIERIQRNAEDWENDKGKESGINYDYHSVKSFAETEHFIGFCTKIGLDSQLLINFVKPLPLILMFQK